MPTKSTVGKSSSPAKKSTAKSTASKSATSKSTASKSTYKPEKEAAKDITLFVKDSKGKTLGEINVPVSHKAQPAKSKKATAYEIKK